MILRLFALCFGCHHGNRSLIYSNRQYCNDCGAVRPYVIGQKPGRWSTTVATPSLPAPGAPASPSPASASRQPLSAHLDAAGK